jgi:hypothetical protein
MWIGWIGAENAVTIVTENPVVIVPDKNGKKGEQRRKLQNI